MALTFFGVDNEFAVSTGSNVGTTANSSTFDNPPQGSKDLVITTKSDDTDPRLFEIGDTYDVSWGGQGGGGTILDAVVVRSDAAPGQGGVIVLEGVDENGNLAQVIWTPDFDLEGWYNANYNPSNEPRFYTEDTQPDYNHTFVCFAAETRVNTPEGYRPVATLQAGDKVRTRDHGDVPLLWAGQRLGPGTGTAAPVVFDPGSIGNTRTLRLSQQHRVLIQSTDAELYFGADEVLVPAKACANGHTIRITPCARICYVHLLFADHEVLAAEGAACESLFLGDEAVKTLYGGPDMDDLCAVDGHPVSHLRTARPVLKTSEARMLLGTHTAPTQPEQRRAVV